MYEAFIQIHNLRKTYDTPHGELTVLDNINLDIHYGEFVAIVGRSGVGKTTLLNMLTGIDKPDAGEIIIDDLNITHTPQRKLGRWRAQNMGIVFQDFELLPSLSVTDNVRAPMDFANIWRQGEREERALRLIEQFDMSEHRWARPDMLSGGQQQRIAIARALANKPMLMVCDEPTGSLDRISSTHIFDQFHALHAQGYTIVVVTHDRELVHDVPRVLELKEGNLQDVKIEQMAPRLMMSSQASPFARLAI